MTDVLNYTLDSIHRTITTLVEEQEKTNDLLRNLIELMKETNGNGSKTHK